MVDLSDRFVRETNGQLLRLSSSLLDLEEAVAADSQASVQVDEPFRIAHSLKGRFATEGLETANDLAHLLESILDRIGTGQLELTATVIDDALAAVEACEALLEEHHEAGCARTDVTQVRELLQNHIDSAESAVDDVSPETTRDLEDGTSENPDDEDLSQDVREALGNVVEFDDLDRVLEELDTNEDDGPWTEDDDADGWGVFENHSERSLREDPDDGSKKRKAGAVGAEDEPSRPSKEEGIGESRTTDEETPSIDLGRGGSADDSTVTDTSDGFDEFISLNEKKEEVDGEEDLEELQADIEAEAFGEFDEDDDMTIEELLDYNPLGEATSSSADHDETSITEDLRTFENMRGDVDPTVEDLEELQADIEAEAFGEFDEDDDMTIEELLEADPSELDPEADLVTGTQPTDDEVVSEADTPVGDKDETDLTLETGQDDGADPDEDEPESPNPANGHREESIEPGNEARNRRTEVPNGSDAVGDQPTAAGASSREGNDEASGSKTEEATCEVASETEPPDSADDAGIKDDGTVREPPTSVDPASASLSDGPTNDSAAIDADQEADINTGSDAHVDVNPNPDSGAVSDPDADSRTTEDDEFDLASQEPFDFTTHDESIRSDEVESELLNDELPDLEGADIGESEYDDAAIEDSAPSASTSDVPNDAASGADEIGVDFAFGFGHEEDHLDSADFDSLFAKYFSEDGVLFGGDLTGAAEAAATIEETRLRDEGFTSAAGPDWRDRTGQQVSRGSVQSLTVDVDNADELLQLAEGLGNTQRRLERAVETGDLDVVEEVVADMRPYTADLHHSVMTVRLMALETVFSRLPRVVRDIANKQNKKVDFSVTGQDVRLDRDIIERLEDPLVHLVRNAVDHGIETPTEREREGKSREGSLELRAWRSRDQAVIELSDDGRGIDADTIRNAAVENGLVTEGEAQTMTREEVLELVFRPQFSTRQEVTDVSGRGVGMDVVRKTVRDLTGSVEIESTPGEGTTIRLTLPVTVALSQVLFVTAGAERFAIPTSAIDAVELAEKTTTVDELASGAFFSDVEQRGTIGALTPGSGVTPLDVKDDVSIETSEDEAEPEVNVDTDEGGTDDYETIRLADAMGIDESDDSDPAITGREKIVRIREEIRRLELYCDAVDDLDEVVIRPFEDVLGGTPGVSGTTTDGDEEIILVLDVQSMKR